MSEFVRVCGPLQITVGGIRPVLFASTVLWIAACSEGAVAPAGRAGGGGAPTMQGGAGGAGRIEAGGTARGGETATAGGDFGLGGTSSIGGSSAGAAGGTGGATPGGTGGATSGGTGGAPLGVGGQPLRIGDATSVISPAAIQRYVTSFNGFDTTEMRFPTAIPNAQAYAWITSNVPLFECSDKMVEELYYYRWWSYRKHIKKLASGFIITEFIHAGWVGPNNSIIDAAGHHFYEGRWIKNRQYLQDYANFWLITNPTLTNNTADSGVLSYSSWLADGVYAAYLVDGERSFISAALNGIVGYYRNAEAKWFDASPGLYHIIPDRDAMEDPISGPGDQYRPTINGYAYGNALAISRMAESLGKSSLAQEFAGKASTIRSNVQTLLWDKAAMFFKVVYRDKTTFSATREEIGFVPWYFNLPADGMGFESAWSQLTDRAGFHAAYGPTTAEQRDPKFRADAGAAKGEHSTEWSGPSWPYATSQTLVALGNLIRGYTQSIVSKSDYLTAFNSYTLSQHKAGHPWIAEDLNPLTGAWIADIANRSEHYNHSSYNDLIIAGLVGLVPRQDSTVEVNPLLPAGAWQYFYLDNVLYHGHRLTIFYDETGARYGKGRGLSLYVDGTQAATSTTLSRIIFPN